MSAAARLFNAASNLLRRPSMRPVTRTVSTLHAAAYRATGGRAQNRKYPTMLLTVVGRKGGKLRTVPLIYLRDGERFVIAAAYSGSGGKARALAPAGADVSVFHLVLTPAT